MRVLRIRHQTLIRDGNFNFSALEMKVCKNG